MVILLLLILALYLYYQNIVLNKKLNVLIECHKAEESNLVTLVHDLKTPTNSQLSTLKMLEDGTFGSVSHEQEEIIGLMSASCRYMANLIQMIIKAHSNSGKINLNKTNFDIIELISELCRETKSLVMEKEQTLIFHNFAEYCYVYADQLQIKRVILNLISNAIIYGYSGTKIEITLKVSEHSCELFIENYSKQIPQEELTKVFDKYSTTEYSHFNKAGTGLGLYLVKQIIEKHNGRVYAKSDKSGKCTFGFIIPNKVSGNKNAGFRKKPTFLNRL